LVAGKDGWVSWSKNFDILVHWLWPLSIGENPGIVSKQLSLGSFFGEDNKPDKKGAG